MVEQVAITSRDAWLAERKFAVTASVMGAVFGCHPYTSPLALYIEKQGLVELPLEPDNAAKRRGRLLEPAVAAAVADERPAWRLEKCQHYYRCSDAGIGATPDYFIYGDPRGLGILQCKTAISSVFDREWIDGRPPRWITLQLATEMMLTDAAFGAVACLVTSFDFPLTLVEMPRDRALENEIKTAVAGFWLDIEAGREPPLDLSVDGDLLPFITPEQEGLSIDLSGDNEAISGLHERVTLKEQIGVAEGRIKEIDTLIKSRMGSAQIAIVPGFSVTWKHQPRKGHTVKPSNPRVLDIRARQ
jgi:predicted phage-related endonuclease